MFSVTPYSLSDQLFLNVEQVIPAKEAEEYTIRMAEKKQVDSDTQEELKTRHKVRFEFWRILLDRMNKTKCNLFQNISPSKYHWIGAGSGMRGVGFNFVISKNYGRCELYIDRGDQDENKKIFDTLFAVKELIETDMGKTLMWERLDNKRASRIKFENSKVNVFNKEDWEEMLTFMIDGMAKFEYALKDRITKINKGFK